MTREEAIRTLNFGAWRDNLNSEMSEADSEPLFEALDMAISALKQQQDQESKPLNGWISVKDRLPDNKEHDWVLAQVVEDNGYMHIPTVMEYRQLRNDWFEETYGWLSEHNGLFSVTHWMPLPHPPKGDKHMDNYKLTPNTTTLENSYDEHIIKVEITFISYKPKSAEEIKKLLDADHVLIESTKVFHHKGRKRRKK